jgi:hypothetical protein
VIEIIESDLETVGPNIRLLSEAVTDYDMDRITFLAHKLKGSFRFIGCTGPGDIMEQIENSNSRGDRMRINELMSLVEKEYAGTENELKQVLHELNAQR